MTCTQLKLLLLDYSLFDYIEEFYSFYVYDKLVADWRLIEKLIIRKYKLPLYNINSLKFYANLMNFGGFCDWKIFTPNNVNELIQFRFESILNDKFKLLVNEDSNIIQNLLNTHCLKDPKIFKYAIRTGFSDYDFLFRYNYNQLPKNTFKTNIIYRNL